jgi:hypothetical protein
MMNSSIASDCDKGVQIILHSPNGRPDFVLGSDLDELVADSGLVECSKN